jgi:RNase H-fold protein (predicted Holliday junction resolvase)
MILAIDPGKDKCGLAVLDESGSVFERKLIARSSISEQVPLFISKYGIPIIVIGKSAFGKMIERELLKTEIKASFIFVPEYNSTREARSRYWKENIPRGWRRLLPAGLRTPPLPVDDYAAIILGERYLRG